MMASTGVSAEMIMFLILDTPTPELLASKNIPTSEVSPVNASPPHFPHCFLHPVARHFELARFAKTLGPI